MQRLKRLWPLALLLLAIAVVFGTGFYRQLSFEAVQAHGAALKGWVDQHWWLGLLILMAAFAGLTASITPGVFFVTILAGYLYGPWVGGVATSFAATVGALLVYWVGRTAARDSLRQWLDRRGGLAKAVCDRIDRDTFMYVLAARLVVSVPFHLINVAAGVVAAPLRPYVLATFLGILPAHLIYCWIGANLASMQGEADLRNVMARFALPLAGIAFLSVGLPLAIRAWRSRRGNDPSPG